MDEIMKSFGIVKRPAEPYSEAGNPPLHELVLLASMGIIHEERKVELLRDQVERLQMRLEREERRLKDQKAAVNFVRDNLLAYSYHR